MRNIEITKQSEDAAAWVFMVEIEEGNGKTEHTVTVGKADKKALSPEGSAEELVDASFRFLLDREPKETILPHFNLMVIAKYFPEYRDEIKKYL